MRELDTGPGREGAAESRDHGVRPIRSVTYISFSIGRELTLVRAMATHNLAEKNTMRGLSSATRRGGLACLRCTEGRVED